MGKLVYLYELDSARCTDREIMLGQKELLREVLVNGNVVVLSYNQIVESRGFFNLLQNKDYFESFVSLLECGKIRISQFENVSTVSEYMISACSPKRPFHFHGWPLRSTQKHLLALISRSLQHADTSEIDMHLGLLKMGKPSTLFDELSDVGEVKSSMLSRDQQEAVLERVKTLILFVLRISPMSQIYLPPRKKERGERRRLYDVLLAALSLKAPEECGLWEEACGILKTILSEDIASDFKDYRSAYVKSLHRGAQAGARAPREVYCLAEAIVNLCYNYAVEMSMFNVSKRYNVSEFDVGNVRGFPSFTSDFFRRLCENWGENSWLQPCDSRQYLRNEECVIGFESGCVDSLAAEISAAMKSASRICSEISEVVGEECAPCNTVPFYWDNLSQQTMRQKKRVRSISGAKTWSTLLSLGLVLILNIPVSMLFAYSVEHSAAIVARVLCSDVVIFLVLFMLFATCLRNRHLMFIQLLLFSVTLAGLVSPLLSSISQMIIVLALTEVLTTHCSRRVKHVSSLLEIAEGFAESYSDYARYRWLAQSPSAAPHNWASSDAPRERRDLSVAVLHVPDRLRKYQKMRTSSSHSELFAQCDEIPLLPLDEGDLRALVADEELFGREYGIIYSSQFNTLCVDPVMDTTLDNDVGQSGSYRFYPYERILQGDVSRGPHQGVVLVVREGEHFLLLKQWRHAIRRSQIGFPRGYGEAEPDAHANARKELLEELGIEPKTDLERLGSITPDSGLSSTVADVFLVTVDSYVEKSGYEGIERVIRMTSEELEQSIALKDGGVDDAFTMAAYMMWKLKAGDERALPE